MENKTGGEKLFSEWSNGLQQFLQLKHSKRLTTPTLKGIFLSNISFIKSYRKNIFGLARTICTQTEIGVLKSLYDCDYVNIPPNVLPKLQISNYMLKKNISQWAQAVYLSSKKMSEKNIATLIVCNSIG